MSILHTRPLLRQRNEGLQLSYQLPHRVYAATSYPVLSPNGSAIIIYGYDTGLRIVWRGGRAFRSPKNSVPTAETVESETSESSNDNAVMVIDSDDEAGSEPPKDEQPNADFEEEETEIDSSHPFEHIIRYIDVPLGAKVLGLAVPQFLPEEARSSLDPLPPILSKMMVVSAICADFSTRVVTMPLTPPHPRETNSSTWGIQTLSLGGHQEIPLGVSITFTYQGGEDHHQGSRSRTRLASAAQASTVSHKNEKWELLVATHSAESSGTLLVHRISITQTSAETPINYSLSPHLICPIQRINLPTPAKSICFNPCSYPSERHSNLLISFSDGYVKIYSCLSPKQPDLSRGRRASNSDAEPFIPEGRWLITLYPGFEQSTGGIIRRKTVVDAQWVLGGRAVIALLANGEWGVWDVEGAGPTSDPGPLYGQSSMHGVTGGSLTVFAVSGRIMGNLPANKSQMSNSIPEERPKFAPMTPSTRRVRETTLLKGTQNQSQSFLYGQVSVVQVNSARDPNLEESILIRRGDQISIIPSLFSLWRNAVRTTGTFDASNRCKVVDIENVHLFGENMISISHLPSASRKGRETDHRGFDILIAAEHRLVILAPKLTGLGQEKVRFETKQQILNLSPSAETDQAMLTKGELDVGGMDRLLSGMAGSNRPLGLRSPLKRSRIFS
ncbi:hypothetical protein V8E54_009684 [Elaphomyces granulatus]